MKVINPETIGKVKIVKTLKAGGEVYPENSVRFYPIATGLLRELEEDTGLVEILEIRGPKRVSKKPESSVSSKEKAKKPSMTEAEEKDLLDSYVRLIDPDAKLDRRKAIKSLRKEVTDMVVKKAGELGKELDPKLELEDLMKEFSVLIDLSDENI